MLKIVAIGGGEIGRPGFPVETTAIDKEIIRLSGKKRPRLLFIPTASSDSSSYAEVVKKHFGARLGCRVETLYLLRESLEKTEIKKRILDADIIYVGGGNTLKMMNAWRRLGVDSMLKEAAAKGIVLAGVSAGAICWFRYGNSDSNTFYRQGASHIRVKGLDLAPLLFCPHFDKEKARPASLQAMMKKTAGMGIAADNCSALLIHGDRYRIIRSKKTASAYRSFWKGGRYHLEKVPALTKLSDLDNLLSKN